MIAERLRKAVLQAAIEGKLTEQLSEDGNAIDLLKQIKTKNVVKNDIPFEIPENWIWTKLGVIGKSNIGLTYKPENIKTSGTLVLRSSNIQNGILTYDDNVFVDLDIPENKFAQVNDILICARNGSKRLVGKAAIIDKQGMSFGAFMSIYRTAFYNYVYYYLQSPYFRQDFDGVSTTTINQITQSNLLNRLIPLPPFEEQKRIVEKLEVLLAEIDKLEQDEKALKELEDKFPEKLKNAIMLSAIQGNLSQRITTKEESSILKKKILAKKEELIKNNIIRKEKQYPIEENEVFIIPDEWESIELADIVHFTKMIKKKTADKLPYLDVKSLRTNEYNNFRTNGEAVEAGDYAILVDGQNSGEIFKISKKGFLGSTLRKIVINPIIEHNYALLILDFYKNTFRDNKRGAAIPHLDFKIFNTSIVPLPSSIEQKHIIEKLDKIFAVDLFR